jgi:hypothetical protein
MKHQAQGDYSERVNSMKGENSSREVPRPQLRFDYDKSVITGPVIAATK